MLMDATGAAGGQFADDGEAADIVDLYGFTGRWLALAHKAMRAELDRRLGEAGGSLSTFQVLRAADQAGAPTQIELAGVLGITGSTLVRHLDRMAAGGLIERQVEGTDRRVRRIRLTPAGRSLLHRLAAVAHQSEHAVAALLSEDERAGLRHALRTIADHFGTADHHVRAPIGT
ncbi:MAG: MarR family transcriptional regulator [Ilumatobacteraceae bacterium]